MKPALTISLTLLCATFAAASYAEPGEWWEITSKTEMPGMPFSMPATTTKVCVAKGSGDDPRQTMQDKECKMTDMQKSGNKTTWKMRCVRNGEVMNGSGEFTSLADGYQGVTRMSGKSGGQTMDMTSNFRGKRIGPACDTAQQTREIEAAQKQMNAKEKQPGNTTKKSASEPKKPAPETPPSDSVLDNAKKLKGMFGF